MRRGRGRVSFRFFELWTSTKTHISMLLAAMAAMVGMLMPLLLPMLIFCAWINPNPIRQKARQMRDAAVTYCT